MIIAVELETHEGNLMGNMIIILANTPVTPVASGRGDGACKKTGSLKLILEVCAAGGHFNGNGNDEMIAAATWCYIVCILMSLSWLGLNGDYHMVLGGVFLNE